MTILVGYLIAVLPLAIFAFAIWLVWKRQTKKIFEQPRPPIKITDLARLQ
mgnify:CR=1 FL=1